MMNETKMNTVEELLSNEELIAKIQAAETPEEIPALLAEMGVEISAEEFLDAYNQAAPEASGDGELDADDLDVVSGGCVHTAARYVMMAKICMSKGQWARAATYLARAVVEAARPCRH